MLSSITTLVWKGVGQEREKSVEKYKVDGGHGVESLLKGIMYQSGKEYRVDCTGGVEVNGI